MNNLIVVLVALYRYRNFPIRTMQPLLENIDGIKSYTIFFKNCETDNLFNLPTTQEEKLFAKLITELNPGLVGFSVLSPFVPIARKLTRLVKENSSSLVIWGGVHPTIFPESCINEVDMLCIGEGEGLIADLAKQLRDKQSYHSIDNLWIKNNDYIIKNPMRPLIKDLNFLPFPSYGNDSYYFIDSNRIARKDPLLLDNNYWVHSSRGCPYSCSFCVNSLLRPLFKNLGTYARMRSVENIISEIKKNLSLRGCKTNYIFFVDECFGKEEAWLKEFEVRYKKEIGLPFFIESNPMEINSTMLKKLVNAGLDTINFGIQTGTDHIRNYIFKRAGKNSEIINLIREMNNYDIKIRCELILDNPYDTEQTLKDTIEFLLQLPKVIDFWLYSLQYFPQYPLTKKAIEDGYIHPDEANIDRLMERTTKNWYFIPKPFPCDKKQMLQNVIWLVAHYHVKDHVVKYSVFGESFCSKLCLMYLNFKSVILNKMLGFGGIICRYRWVSYFISGIKYVLKGDIKTFHLKLKNIVLIKE